MPLLVNLPPTPRARAVALLRTIQSNQSACPCHSNPGHRHPIANRPFASPSPSNGPSKEYAFEMASSTIRFGRGCTREIGHDVTNLGKSRGLSSPKVLLVTDPNLATLPPVATVRHALSQAGHAFSEYTAVRVEPTDKSVWAAILKARELKPDVYVAVGGGSVLDTAKLMSLYTTHASAPLSAFIPAPLGTGQDLPPTPLAPLIAVPTTAGTGSETTGTAIFDLTARKAKTGVAHRLLRPTLGICDPLNTRSMPVAVAVASGLDVLCHALESWTAVPFRDRPGGAPADPALRPAYQGANPISDVFSLRALRACIKYLPMIARGEVAPATATAAEAAGGAEDLGDPGEEMCLAAALAGVGFGNAGVHLCHGMSYPISGTNPRGYRHAGYEEAAPLIPHGVSVSVTAPAVFRFTGASNPSRHLAAAEMFGVDVRGKRPEDAGAVLGDAVREFLVGLGSQPRGLRGLGFTSADVDGLVEGTIPQKRVLMLAPGLEREEGERQREQVRELFKAAMEY